MKFKDGEIKPGMVIHCQKEEDARALLEHLDDLGYKWIDETKLTETVCWNDVFGKGVYYCLDGSKYVTWKNKKPNDEITEFSDLIEPEPRFKVGDRVRVKKIKEVNIKSAPIRRIAEIYEGVVFTISSVIECSDGALYEGRENAYKWSEEMLEPVDDSPINSGTDSPMTAEELLEWVINHDSKKEIAEIFDTDAVCFSDLLCRGIPATEILDKITAYEAAKKALKPVEAEFGWYCEILKMGKYGALEAVDQHEMWEGDQKAAMDEAAERARQYAVENGVQTYFRVYGICRVKEDES